MDDISSFFRVLYLFDNSAQKDLLSAIGLDLKRSTDLVKFQAQKTKNPRENGFLSLRTYSYPTVRFFSEIFCPSDGKCCFFEFVSLYSYMKVINYYYVEGIGFSSHPA
jgi:hypothetical protein